MKRIPLLLSLALIVGLLPGSAAGDMRETKKLFKQAFRFGAPAEERQVVVGQLAGMRTKDSAELIVSGITVSQGILDDLFEQKRVVDRANSDAGGEYKSQIESKKLKVVIDEELKVLDALQSALNGMSSPKLVEYLGKGVIRKHKLWRAREMAVRSLGENSSPDVLEFLLDALEDKDERVQTVGATILGKRKVPEALEGLVKLLKEKGWGVRAAAIEALGEIGERGAVGPLVAHIGEETGRIRDDCAKVLEKLTGQKFGPHPDIWRKWWKDVREQWEGDGELPFGEVDPKSNPKEEDDSYYGIPIVTRKAIFILDISHSMVYGMKNAQEMPEGDELSKFVAARNQLIRTLSKFDSKGAFNVIAFNAQIFPWKPKMTPSTPANKLKLKKWVGDLEAESTTNIYEALETAFRQAGMGLTDKEYALGLDTIFLLSDGTPTNPDGTDDDPDKVIRAVREWNRMKRVRIHTIGFSGHNIEFMTQLAAENGGRYVRR